MDFIKFALKQGADDIIIERLDSQTKQVRFSNNNIQIFKNWKNSIYKIFLSYKKRTVNTTVFDISEDSVKNNIKNLLKTAKMLKPNESYFGIAEGPFKYKKIPKNYDKKIVDAPVVDIVGKMINSASENSKNTAGVLYTGIEKRELNTSSNVSTSEKSTSIQLSIRAFNKDDESGHAASCSKNLNKISPEKIGRKAGEIAKLAKKPQKIKSGKFRVIFDPLAISNLLSLIGTYSSVFFVDSGRSFLRGKMGKQVGAKIVNLQDNGRIVNGYDSRMFDDEGVPTKKTNIIEKGILKTYLHNTSTAKKYKTKTTANAGITIPTPTNIILKEGKVSKEKMFKDFSGLYITNVWYTRFQNYLNGDFSTIPRDGIFLIENGEFVKSLKGIRVSDNLQSILKKISNISNKPEWVIWWGFDAQVPVLSPYVLVDNVNITQATM